VEADALILDGRVKLYGKLLRANLQFTLPNCSCRHVLLDLELDVDGIFGIVVVM